MKFYYPKDSHGNIIGFKTPESQVYDNQGITLTDKLNRKANDVDLKDTNDKIDSMSKLYEEKLNIITSPLSGTGENIIENCTYGNPISISGFNSSNCLGDTVKLVNYSRGNNIKYFNAFTY